MIEPRATKLAATPPSTGEASAARQQVPLAAASSIRRVFGRGRAEEVGSVVSHDELVKPLVAVVGICKSLAELVRVRRGVPGEERLKLTLLP